MTDRVMLAAVAIVLGIGVPAWMSQGIAWAEEFRVENKVFVGDEKEPVVESTTIFYENVVYDYLSKPSEVTIFDKARGRFILLDLGRRVKTEVSTERVGELTERLKQWAGSQADPFLKFLSDPKFDVHYDEEKNELSCASAWLTYRVLTDDIETEAVGRRYSEFSDWYCQLNTMLNPGSRPPQARMLLNAALEARQRFPREVHLSFRPKDSLLTRRITMRSQHQLVCQLVQSDRDRVAQTDQLMAMFTPVTFVEYQKRIGP